MRAEGSIGESLSKASRGIAVLHYAAPPVVGGVEGVIEAHVRTFAEAGHDVTVIAGRGDEDALPKQVDFLRIPLLDTRHPRIAEMNSQLEEGSVPPDFDGVVDSLVETLGAKVGDFSDVIVHNVLTKRFNLPLTQALFRLLDEGLISHCIVWCHDIGWTSEHSRPNLHRGHPWDLLRTYREDVTYVAVSEQRRQALASLFDCPPEEIRVVYNGVDPTSLLGMTEEGRQLIDRLNLLAHDMILLMPVRVTEAKNIELALGVVAALKARNEDVTLILTGPPDPHDEESMGYFRELQALRRELGVEDEMRFVFESGPEPGEGYAIGMPVVADLFRVCDAVFMPSHREGFGMPVLEAGLVGKPMISTAVPAAKEIGQNDVMLVDHEGDPEEVAERILSFVVERPVHRLRRRIRRNYTWQAIFKRDIQPLLKGDEPA